MNCTKCISRQVCFLQKQIEGLADRIANKPFNDGFYDTDTDRIQRSVRQYERLMVKQAEIAHKLKDVVASNCKLYR